jgi:hypothetical protein
MNHYFQKRNELSRLPTEEQEGLDRISTDYCGKEGKPRLDINDVRDIIQYQGSIGGNRL